LYHASRLPAGLKFNPATGVISGKPAFTGQKIVFLGASNIGGTKKYALTLNVDPHLKSWTRIAGSYDGLLEHKSAAGHEDGAVYRGLVTLTIHPTGVFSGRLFYNQSTRIADGTSRVYTPVSRAFSGVLKENPTDPLLMQKVVKLGTSTARGSQELTIDLSFKTQPASINVEVRDFVSPSVGEPEWVSQSLIHGPSTGKLAATRFDAGHNPDFAKAIGSYTLSSTDWNSTSANDAYLLVQLHSGGRMTWTSRSPGASGSGSTNWNIHADGTIRASVYDRRLIFIGDSFKFSSLLGGLEFLRDPQSLNWSASVNSAALPQSLEKQFSYVFKSDDNAAEPQNQTGIIWLDFSAKDGLCLDRTRLPVAYSFLVGTPATPLTFVLAARTPFELENSSGYHRWKVSFNSSGVSEVMPLADSFGLISPELVLNLNKFSGKISGFYNSSLTGEILRHEIHGCVLRSATDDSLRARGWLECNTGTTTVTSGWTLDLGP
jgi:hypothetical protein